jgi:hypothetical protein
MLQLLHCWAFQVVPGLLVECIWVGWLLESFKHCKDNLKIDPYSPSFRLIDMKNLGLAQNFAPDPTYNISSVMSDP